MAAMASTSNLAKLLASDAEGVGPATDQTAVTRALRTLRTHLSMDLAFISVRAAVEKSATVAAE
jgi:hypothetical protein